MSEENNKDAVIEAAEENRTEKNQKRKLKLNKKWAAIIGAVLVVLLLPVSYFGYIYAASPLEIREPLLEHYHFRMQISVEGKAEDFSRRSYQMEYAKDQCSTDLPDQPIHFHDNKDQIVHVHWEGMTGGLVLKNYGWNFIGGIDNALGYRMEKITEPKKVPIHSESLPSIPEGAKYYVFVGDEKGFEEKNWEDWLNQDLEKFFGVTSNFPAHEMNQKVRTSAINDFLFTGASAHGGVDDGHVEADESTEERLTRINNLIGNVVIFVQKDKPSEEQIKQRFTSLVPLSESTCGG